MMFYTTSGKRLQFLQEVMVGIRFIKGCGAESIVQNRMEKAREVEIRSLDTFYTIQCFMFILSLQFPKLYLLASLGGYALFHHGVVEPTVIMSLIPLLMSVQGAIAVVFSLIPTLVMALPSCRRLETFLKMPEAPRAISAMTNYMEPPWVTVLPEPEPGAPPQEVGFSLKGSFGWSPKLDPNLEELDIVIPQGSLVAVCGQVGAGKTTLMHAILGELFPFGDARVEVKRRIAYSAQSPHLFEGTMRENILKGDEYDEERYKLAVHGSGLLPDIEILPGGDAVPVGGRGITLSGGQKARCSLARAAYDKANTILMDDPFAAVDTHTGRHLNDHLLHGPLLKGRTRIVVCQPDRDRIPRFDWVIILGEGRILAQGPPAEIMHNEHYLALTSSIIEGEHEEEEAVGPLVATGAGKTLMETEEAFQLREEECEGRASWSTLAYFGRMGGWLGISTCIVMYLVKNVLDMRTQIQLSIWMSHGSMYDAGLVTIKPNPCTLR